MKKLLIALTFLFTVESQAGDAGALGLDEDFENAGKVLLVVGGIAFLVAYNSSSNSFNGENNIYFDENANTDNFTQCDEQFDSTGDGDYDTCCRFPEEGYNCDETPECVAVGDNLDPNTGLDCNGVCGGDAVIDECGVCTGGNVSIGERSAISIGSTIKHGIKIGHDVVVGANSLVMDNIKSNQVVYGTPAKFVRKRSKGDKYL